MSDNSLASQNSEEARIQAVYARRVNGNRYSLFNPANIFTVQERERMFLQQLQRSGYADLKTKRILDVGCGSGGRLRDLIRYGAPPENLFGIDLLPQEIANARRLSPASVTFACGSATHLDFPDEMFDCVMHFTMFTSILDPSMKRQSAAEMLRVLRPNGMILWYDFRVNNPQNPDVRGIGRREIYNLFPDCRVQLRTITLAPPLCRMLAPYSWLLCHVLSQVPLLCTHYMGVITRDKTLV